MARKHRSGHLSKQILLGIGSICDDEMRIKIAEETERRQPDNQIAAVGVIGPERVGWWFSVEAEGGPEPWRRR
jgi:hypothetical protein